MYRICKVLLVMSLIAGYAYVSNQDYEDQQMIEAINK